MESGHQLAQSCMLAFAAIIFMTGLMVTTCSPSNNVMEDGCDRVLSTQRRLSDENYFPEVFPTVSETGLLSQPSNMLANREKKSSFDVPWQSDIWAMELSPEENSLYFMMADIVWRSPLNQSTEVKINVTPYAGPYGDPEVKLQPLYPHAFPKSFAIVRQKIGNTSSTKRIVYAANAYNRTLYSYFIDGPQPTVPYEQDLTNIIGDGNITSLASDWRRPIVYLSTGRRIFRLNLTRQVEERPFADVEPWIGSPGGRTTDSRGRDSNDPYKVEFGQAFLSKYAISADGSVFYVADRESQVIRRVDVASGAVSTIAGHGSQGQSDGLPFEATFDGPQGLALTSDGCYLFVADFAGGGIRLITFNNSGGSVVNVRTVATMERRNWRDTKLLSLAISPEGDKLYAGTYARGIFVFSINKSALPSCSSPPPTSSPASPPSEQKGIPLSATVAAVVLPLLIFFAAVIACIVWRKKLLRKKQLTFVGETKDALIDVSLSTDTWTGGIPSDRKSSPPGLQLPDSSLKWYPFKEMADACDGFNPSNLLGEGGAAEVFKGVLSSGQVIAIKLMKGEFAEAKFRQFQAELSVLSTLRHSHLLHIIGYSTDGHRSLIVYPFVGGGTLYDRLHALPAPFVEPGGSRGSGTSESASLTRAPLDWTDRVSISIQVAKALRYLHEEVDPPIIHRDVKSKNVLVDGDGRRTVRAYLSDFGLAKHGQSIFGKETAMETVETYHVAGTIGYMAPEYYGSLRLTNKNDVYAFGVLLLELITGRKAFSSSPSDVANGTQTIALWTNRKLRGTENNNSTVVVNLLERVREIADVRLETAGTVDWSSVRGVLELAMECVREEPGLRPSMSAVLDRLSRSLHKRQ